MQRGGEELAGDPVAAVGLERQGLLAHPGQLGAGAGEVVALALELRGNRHDDNGLPRAEVQGGAVQPSPRKAAAR